MCVVSLGQFKGAKNRPRTVGSAKKYWDGAVSLNMALSAFFEDHMLTLPFKDRLAIEKQPASPDAIVILSSVSTIDATDADGFFPGERLQQEEAPARRDRQEGLPEITFDAPSVQSDVRVTWFALAFVGFLCTMFIAFVSEIGPLRLLSSEYGYDEAVGTKTSSLSSANFLTSCVDDSPRTDGVSKDGLDRLGVSALEYAASSLTATFKPTNRR
ncbi:MAG: hypothetical protein JOZ58_15905 [Acetobacteraceae bacterium]|nr:hypothetical protein [Acetobacteraceae bacterium]